MFITCKQMEEKWKIQSHDRSGSSQLPPDNEGFGRLWQQGTAFRTPVTGPHFLCLWDREQSVFSQPGRPQVGKVSLPMSQNHHWNGTWRLGYTDMEYSDEIEQSENDMELYKNRLKQESLVSLFLFKYLATWGPLYLVMIIKLFHVFWCSHNILKQSLWSRS